MITLRESESRGGAEYGWLKPRYTFSFASFYDPQWMSFRSLRVINEDIIAAGRGFATHPHDNMEIISYIVSGELRHQDSMGSGSVIARGEVQLISAGTGISHSENNPSDENPTHMLQIWIEPERTGLPPGYDQRVFSDEAKRDRLCPIATPGGREGSLVINQDVNLYASLLSAEKAVQLDLAGDRHAWVQVISGEVALNGVSLRNGDGAAVSDETVLRLSAIRDAEFLLFDLA
ncbi:pirin family protein [bacterium]|nr:pirin family protein [bacterium]